ncbi:hypothetical protein D3C76_506000 [compost metagenome]|uniref:Uncharacterized protein n=1 Tax=Pseudomonas jinjuensis TaxID=198616 RepID=A0A1H0LY11_9PSED|nr:hypothetical protein [Pseudomonas jinjuensis]SDO73037.1 hypothetical protein SAMN05216193_11510 [Pseudomonas jinjuensis]
MKRLSLPGALFALAVSPAASAHGLFCECKALDAEQVRCIAGMSDGSAAPGATLDVVGYDGGVILPGKLGADSSLTFRRPPGEFYVLFDLGPGHTVEVDHRDISAP